MSRPNGNTDKFKKCAWCGSRKTTEVACTQDEETYRYVYFGWCKDCKDTYNYTLSVQTIWDRKGRI